MATIQGINPYASLADLIKERCGITPFKMGTAAHWGNLFEDLLKQYVEHALGCSIIGEDLYTLGRPCTSYSPDGLGVIERHKIVDIIDLQRDPSGEMRDMRAYPDAEIALFEFKCPFSRIPNGCIPKYYTPQVLMGLDLLEIPTVGVYAEAVIRRCSWDQLGYNPDYDKSLVRTSSGDLPVGYGIIGFYINPITTDNEKNTAGLEKYYKFYDTLGTAPDYNCNDLGESPPDLFIDLMAIVDCGSVSVKYFPIHYGANCETAIDADLAGMTEFCRANDYQVVGILPYKIFRVDYHIVEKRPNYIDQWYDKIVATVDIIKKCRENPSAAEMIIAEFAMKNETSIGGSNYKKRN